MSENIIESERFSNLRESISARDSASFINTPNANNGNMKFIANIDGVVLSKDPVRLEDLLDISDRLDSLSSMDADVPNEDIEDLSYQTPYHNQSFIMRPKATPASAAAPTPSSVVINQEQFLKKLNDPPPQPP